MATAASDKPAQADAPKPRRVFWRRIPTPIVVTLLGIALSAWLLPAITRQWDDRQKAHELQAAIITDMASATSGMLTRGEERHARELAEGLGRRQRAAANQGVRSIEWSQASLQLEARLHAYFPRRIVEAWQLYSYFVTWFDSTTRVPGRADTYYIVATHLEEDPHRLDDHTRKEVANLTTLAQMVDNDRTTWDDPYDSLSTKDLYPGDHRERKLREFVKRFGPQLPHAVRLATRNGKPLFRNGRPRLIYVPRPASLRAKLAVRQWRLSVLEEHLSALETSIANQVLAADPRGYSTTAGDLFRDLIP
jgi:hypothetical protein